MSHSVDKPTVVHLVRHGEVDNPTEIYYGREHNLPLSRAGRDQAAAAGEFFEERSIAAIFHSPLLRTTQTAAILGDRLRLDTPLQPDNRLLEVYSPYDGMPMAQLEAMAWDLYSDTTEPYEQPADILQRLHQFFRAVTIAYPGREIIGVTHGDVVAFALMWGLGKPIIAGGKNNFEAQGWPDPYPATASISTFLIAQPPPAPPDSVTYRNPYRSA